MVRLLKKEKRLPSMLATFAIATFGLHVFTLVLLIFQGLTIRQLALRKPATFVQMVDGMRVSDSNELSRRPEEVREFVVKTMTAIFSWSGKLPAENIEDVSNPKLDPGIQIRTPSEGNKKVTTSSWIASFGLSEDFRKGFLSLLAQMTPPEVFTENQQRAMSAQLKIKRVEPPQEIEVGKWRVGIVADLIQFRQSGDSAKENRQIITPFNKDVLVRTVDNFTYPLPDKTTDLQKAVNSVRADKLEIYEIRDLCLLDEDDLAGSKGCESEAGQIIK